MSDINVTAIIFQLIGGLGLFLMGMQFMSEGLQKSSGNSLKVILGKLTSNRYIGTGVGAVVTSIIQSSSATTVMVVGFVNAGLMNLTQALSVILGANIGTTITGQIIAFKISIISMPAIGIGAILLMFFKKPALQYAGQIIFGFGILFLGMDTMTKAFSPLSASESFKSVFVYFSHNPIAAVLAGMITTLIVQSSSATIGITLALASAGIVDFPAAAALVLGENIGTTITANIAAINASRTAKQAAFGHFLFNFIGVAYMLILLKPFMALVDFITPGDVSYSIVENGKTVYPYIQRHIVNLHTMFNVINTAVFLPFLPLLAKLCEKIIRPKETEEKVEKVVHLSDAMLSTPEIAVGMVEKETEKMYLYAVDLFNYAKKSIVNNDNNARAKGKEMASVVYMYQKEIDEFLTKLSTKSLSESSVIKIHKISTAILEIKQMSERCLKLIKTVNKMHEKNIAFSETAVNELKNIMELVENFSTNVKNLYVHNIKNINKEEIFKEEDSIDEVKKIYKKNHINRLDKGLCSLPAGLAFIELLNTLEKIADNIYAVALLSINDDI